MGRGDDELVARLGHLAGADRPEVHGGAEQLEPREGPGEAGDQSVVALEYGGELGQVRQHRDDDVAARRDLARRASPAQSPPRLDGCVAAYGRGQTIVVPKARPRTYVTAAAP
nr:hypothetical protein DA06_20620 [Georgenia sp. SUBG003]